MNRYYCLPPGVFEKDLLEPPVCDIQKQQTPLVSVGATPGTLLPAGSTRDSEGYFVSWTVETFCLGSQAALLHCAGLADCLPILLPSAQF